MRIALPGARAFGLVALAVAMATPMAHSAAAGEAWPEVRAAAYGTRTLNDGSGIIKLEAPYRPDDVRSVPLTAEVAFKDGRSVKSVSFIVDENPSPVAAVFKLGGKRERVALTTNIRLNQQSDVHIVAEASDGELYVVGQLVKFAGGQASCSAPPMGDPAEIAANMGKMQFALTGPKAVASHATQKVAYRLSHPNHTGMVLDQITLLYVPLLMVEKIEARQGDELVFEMTGSITVAQDPRIDFDFVTNGAEEMTFTATDTSGGTWTQKFPIGPAS